MTDTAAGSSNPSTNYRYNRVGSSVGHHDHTGIAMQKFTELTYVVLI
jgi:hypothetical protein